MAVVHGEKGVGLVSAFVKGENGGMRVLHCCAIISVFAAVTRGTRDALIRHPCISVTAYANRELAPDSEVFHVAGGICDQRSARWRVGPARTWR